MLQNEIGRQDMALNNFKKKLKELTGINLVEGFNQPVNSKQGQIMSIFIYHALKNDPEQEYIIDIEIDLASKTAILYHIALPVQMRCKGLGTKIVIEIEMLLVQLGITYISLPAEHHSTGFWLKAGYRFKFEREHHFYRMNENRKNLQVAYELEKVLETSTNIE